MAVLQQTDETTYAKLALAEPNGILELIDGVVRVKPGMSWNHSLMISRVAAILHPQLADARYVVLSHSAHLRVADGTTYVPDLAVIPLEFAAPYVDRPGLPIFAAPLPLVVEVWSPSTGAYDVDAKIPDYQRRGDLEIWRIHPYERTLTAWRRQPDGTYAEMIYQAGVVEPTALPGVRIDVSSLFRD